MRIIYNSWACQGHARCFELAPDLFNLDAEGLAFTLVEGEVTSELQEKARLVAQRCPEFAIEIREE